MSEIIFFDLEGSENCRDIGGHNTKYGKVIKKKLVRASQLNKLTESDIEQLKKYGVRKIIDLRGIKEREVEPDAQMKFAENIHIPIFYDMRIPVLNDGFMKDMFPQLKLLEEVLLKQRKRMLQVYRNFVTEESAINAYKQIFQALLSNDKENESILFHCTAGKDRTGFVTALILSALGVEKNEIMQDYLITNTYMSKKVKSTIEKLERLGVSSKVIDKAQGYFMAKEEYLEEAFKMIKNQYGSMDEFLNKQIGLSKRQRVLLYDNYTVANR